MNRDKKKTQKENDFLIFILNETVTSIITNFYLLNNIMRQAYIEAYTTRSITSPIMFFQRQTEFKSYHWIWGISGSSGGVTVRYNNNYFEREEKRRERKIIINKLITL